MGPQLQNVRIHPAPKYGTQLLCEGDNPSVVISHPGTHRVQAYLITQGDLMISWQWQHILSCLLILDSAESKIANVLKKRCKMNSETSSATQHMGKDYKICCEIFRLIEQVCIHVVQGWKC